MDAFIIAISSIAVNRSSIVYDRFYFSDKFIISVLEESAIDRLLLLDVLHAIMRYLQVINMPFSLLLLINHGAIVYMRRILLQNFDYEVQPTTVKDRVYEILKREIVLGKLKPGEPINIAVLSTKLNISSAPLREALNMLSRDGLVTLNPRKHAAVSEIDEGDMVITMHLRLLLEPYAAELSIHNIPQNVIEHMRAELNGVLDDPYNEERYIQSDLNLHEILYRYSNSDIVVKTISVVKEYSIRLRYYVEVFGSSNEEGRKEAIHSSTLEHLQILDAVEARDVERVKKLVYDHIKNGIDRNNSAKP